MGWGLAGDVVVLTDEQEIREQEEDGGEIQAVESDASGAFDDLEALQLIRVQGRDKQGRRIVRVVGKFLHAAIIDAQRLQRFVVLKLARFELESFVIVYFHTCVQSGENSPGVKALHQIHAALPAAVRQKLEIVYFVHPGIRSRLILATLGRIFLSDGLYWKLHYVSRVEFLRDYIKDDQLEVPEFVEEHDGELENNPLVDYGICVDPLHAELKAHDTRFPSTSGAFL
ncbi:hypothetical protein SELMODRAFT_168470 [Selaginella moellendorffii]|uniref:CRAL-TRIO domain-containing protein n=1 Tax=Selaginella moellendorffii TaxID=88036 RepID=D8R540_SELML|nr:uncharacterized protein LOC9652603 [Selaginella moellendorffii]EFJ32777.1 hypothetical protein SELMODRAFT_168470 [Selaginella moellendorffii]|eukprot:XP_002966750.1 uncharacterized protein LOC9652603 [Selaginella moellendorffii]